MAFPGRDELVTRSLLVDAARSGEGDEWVIGAAVIFVVEHDLRELRPLLRRLVESPLLLDIPHLEKERREALERFLSKGP